MSDIDILIAKHFCGETSVVEEQEVQQYKQEHPDEYDTMRAFWKQDGVEISKYDSSAAWKKVKSKAEQSKRPTIYRRLKLVASVAAAVALISLLAVPFFQELNDSIDMVNINATGRAQMVELADGSIVYLNENSTISYPIIFHRQQRQVTLQGEAFFEVARDVDRPFTIVTAHSEVEVLGTSFNVNAAADQTEVSVSTGKVKVTSTLHDRSVTLVPSQTALASETELRAFGTPTQNYQAWRTGRFSFENTPIAQAIQELSTYYDDDIILTNATSDCLLTATLDQQNMEEVIEIIKLSCGLQLKQENDRYELY